MISARLPIMLPACSKVPELLYSTCAISTKNIFRVGNEPNQKGQNFRHLSLSARNMKGSNDQFSLGERPNVPFGESDVTLHSTMSAIKDGMLERKDICVSALSTHGFRLADNTFLYGPVALFPKLALSWKVLTPDHITEQSVRFVHMLEPRIDIVVVGAGDREHTTDVRQRLLPFFRKHKIPLEVLPSEDAVSVFNWLNEERRYVVGLLYPPDHMQMSQRQQAHAALTAHRLSQDTDGTFMPLDRGVGPLNIFGASWEQLDDYRRFATDASFRSPQEVVAAKKVEAEQAHVRQLAEQRQAQYELQKAQRHTLLGQQRVLRAQIECASGLDSEEHEASKTVISNDQSLLTTKKNTESDDR